MLRCFGLARWDVHTFCVIRLLSNDPPHFIVASCDLTTGDNEGRGKARGEARQIVRKSLRARGEDLLPSEMSRSRRLILSIYRGSNLTQLFIRWEYRLCSRGAAPLPFSISRCERGNRAGGREDCAT